MTFLAWQRRARKIADRVSTWMDAGGDASVARAMVLRVLIARAYRSRDALEATLDEAAQHGRSLAEWLRELAGDPALDHELAALAARHGGGDAAPFVLEHLQHALDPRARVANNLYATPTPVARYMARAALDAITHEFKGDDASEREGWVALDPACGVGALLIALGREAGDRIRALHGIERDPVALAGARWALGLALGPLGRDATLTERDALSGPWVDRDAERSIIIVANPPFADDRDASAYVRALTRGLDARSRASYRPRAGEPTLRNGKWLDRAELRFLRWIHGQCDRAERAIAVVALGHALVDRETFAPVRRALRESFDEISVLDLHGAARNGLETPEGARDQNVFEIQQGVCIVTLVRRARRTSRSATARVRHADLWGTREEKFAALSRGSIPWRAVTTSALHDRWSGASERSSMVASLLGEDALSTSRASSDHDERERAWSRWPSLREVFERHAPAIITGCDEALLAFTEQEAHEKAQRLGIAKDALRIARWMYRPWDERFAIDDPSHVHRPRSGPVMDALRTGQSLALVTRKQAPPERRWNYGFITRLPVCDGVLRADPHGTEVVFSREILEDGVLQSNLRRAWLDEVARRLHRTLDDDGAHRAFEYIVGVVMDEDYRQRFGSWLARELPRVPWPTSATQFEDVRREGARWIALHTAPIEPVEPLIFHNMTIGHTTLERVYWSALERRVVLGPGRWIEGVDEGDVTFTVGARRPALRWLEDRVGRAWTTEMASMYATMLARVRRERAMRAHPRVRGDHVQTLLQIV